MLFPFSLLQFGEGFSFEKFAPVFVESGSGEDALGGSDWDLVGHSWEGIKE